MTRTFAREEMPDDEKVRQVQEVRIMVRAKAAQMPFDSARNLWR